MNDKTAHEYKEVIAFCKGLFARKTHDYGTAWRVCCLEVCWLGGWLKFCLKLCYKQN